MNIKCIKLNVESNAITDSRSSDGSGHSEYCCQHCCQLGEHVRVDVMRQEELERLDLCPTPAAHLHHEALDALEDQLSPLHAPGHRHLLRHLV